MLFRSYFEKMDHSAVLELACGHGRHAEACVDQCGSMILMDIFQSNLDICKTRLKGSNKISYLKNDGFSFRPVDDNNVTAIYCYDAMVHFSPDIIESYLKDAFRVLAPGGKALFHHSNYPAPLDRHYGQNPHARNHMTQSLFCEMSERHGLEIEESVVMDWSDAEDLDCLTLVRKAL